MKRTDGAPLRTGDLLEPFDRTAPPPAAGIAAYMLWDHARLASMLGRAVDRARAGEWDSARTVWAMYAEGLQRHVRIEEEIVYPVIERKYANGHPRITTPLRLQHKQLSALLDELGRGFRLENGPAVAQAGDDLSTLLLGHEQMEEEAVYPECDQILAPEGGPALVQRIQELSSEPAGD